MGRKKKLKDVASLMVQSKAHSMLADDRDVDVKSHTRKFWRRESTRYQEQIDEIIDKARFPESYLHELEYESQKKAQKIYLKKKKEIGTSKR